MVCVCPSWLSHVKTTELIEVLFRMESVGGPENILLEGGPNPLLGGEWRELLPTVRDGAWDSLQPSPSYLTTCFFQSIGLSVKTEMFLSPDAVRLNGICYGNVAICVSVTLMYCAQTTESINIGSSPDCSPSILVFPHQILTR